MAAGGLGQRIVDLVADVTHRSRASVAHHEAAVRNRATYASMEHLERELAPTVQRIFAHLIANPDTPDAIKALVVEPSDPTHQIDFILQILAVIVGAPGLMGAVNAGLIDQLSGDHRAIVRGAPADLGAIVSQMARERDESFIVRDAAARHGLNEDQLDTMVSSMKHGPSLGEAITLYQRGQIPLEMLSAALRDLAYDGEWILNLPQLARGPLGAGTAVMAAVQGHLDRPTMTALVRENGVDEKWADVWYETAGRPPGTESLLDLLNRGEITEPEVRQAVAESDVKTKYTDAILRSRYVLPPERTIVGLVRRSVITEARGRRLLAMRGYFPEDIDAMIREAVDTRHDTTKDLAQGTITALYEQRVVTRGEAEGLLAKLRYDTTEVRMILDLADVRHDRRLQTSAQTKVRSLFIGYRIDEHEASNALDGLHTPVRERDDLLAMWRIERGANAPDLTHAQVIAAGKKGVLDDAGVFSRLKQVGYSDTDAGILMQTAGLTPPGK